MRRAAANPLPFPARRGRRLGLALLGASLLALPLLVAIAGGNDPTAQDLMRSLQGPSLAHPFGFDHLGRDVLARVVHGAPRSLGYAALCIVLSAVAGTLLGLVAARAGRWLDMIIMRLGDVTLAFPGILLALLLASVLGPGPLPVLIGINLALWPQFARLTRVTAAAVLAEPHVEAAYLAGFSTPYILWHNVLPQVTRQTLPLVCLSFANAILSISSLGFLGLGLQPPTPEWGLMISEMLPYLHQAPLQLAAPCGAIFLTILALILLSGRITAPIGRPGGRT